MTPPEELFGMGKLTAQNVSTEFQNALAARRDDFIRFPTTHNEIQTTIDNFEMKYGIPKENSCTPEILNKNFRPGQFLSFALVIFGVLIT